jgi:glycosyltransferase A (GT-A) superfamily protein (DUF2064 family)
VSVGVVAAGAQPDVGVTARVVVIAADPEGSRRRHAELGAVLGEERVDELQALLERRTLAWAYGVDGEAAVVPATTDLAAVVGTARPTVIVWPELPVWLPQAGPAALEDLASGCAVSIGPVFDGALYLLALAEPIPELLALARRPWHGVQAMARVFGVVEQRKLEVGLLRAERGLRTPDDVRALLADPLTDKELRGLLG